MNTIKKIAVVLAVMMVAAMAAPAAMGDNVGYEAVVCTHQNTFICCGVNGDFGDMLPTDTSPIVGTFGLKNVGGWNAAVFAAFTTQAVGGDHGLVKIDDNTVAISAHNFELKQSGLKSNPMPCGVAVVADDPDEGWVLTVLPGLAYVDLDTDVTFDCGEPLYNDNDASGVVSVGDDRKTDWWYPCGSIVAAGDADIGIVLTLIANGAFADMNGDVAFDCGEPIYIDNEPSGDVSAGDDRLTDVYAACDCIDSEGCCPGSFDYVPLADNGVDVLIDGIVPRDGACCCCYDAELFVPGGTAAGTYQGTVQLTFA